MDRWTNCFLTLAVFLSNLCFSPYAVIADEPTEVFRIGAILPLTGPTADYGTPMQYAMELAQKAHPERFKNIKFVYEDAVYDTKKGVDAFHRLRSVSKVDLIYVWGVTFCKAIAMVTSDNPYIAEYQKAFENQLTPPQTLKVVQNYTVGENDFRTAILKLKKHSFDSLGVFLAPGQIGSFYRQAKELGLTTPTFGTNLFESPAEIRSSNGAMDGAIFVTAVLRPQFRTSWESAPNAPGQLGFGSLAYEFTTLVGELFATAPKPEPDAILDAFRQVKTHVGTATLDYSFQDDRDIGQYFRFPVSVESILNDVVGGNPEK